MCSNTAPLELYLVFTVKERLLCNGSLGLIPLMPHIFCCFLIQFVCSVPPLLLDAKSNANSIEWLNV